MYVFTALIPLVWRIAITFMRQPTSFIVLAWFEINSLVTVIFIILDYYTEERISQLLRGGSPKSRAVVI